MAFTREQIEDAVRFSNFCQRVKLAYWKKPHKSEDVMRESALDEVLLLAWDELKWLTPALDK